jgi:protein-tyrosine phosphatase
MRILMVCLGNICRSPLAEGILQHMADRAGLNWTVESAGTNNWHAGEAPHPLSQKVARLNGIDISRQKARQFRKEDMERFDRIYVMDRSNYADVRHMAGDAWNEHKVELLLNELYPGENREVPDPWYGEEDGYHHVFELISRACAQIIEKYSNIPRPQAGTLAQN